MAKALDPRIQQLIDLIEPPEDGAKAGITSDYGSGIRGPKSSDPHVGLDINRGKGVAIHGAIKAPVQGKIVYSEKSVKGLGRIIIHEIDPVTGQPTGWDVE